MRVVIQRVLKSNVIVKTEVSSIENGLCILVGLSKSDEDSDLEYIAQKILSLRLFDDWKSNVKDKNYEILCGTCFLISLSVYSLCKL